VTDPGAYANATIIGNTIDPMTPFENALAVRGYLNDFNISSTIINWDSVSHTALITDSPLSECVFQNVDQFLLDKNHSANIECNDWENPFAIKSKDNYIMQKKKGE